MASSGNLSDLKIRYGRIQWQARPFFIDARSWEAFESYVWGGIELPAVAEMMGTSVRNIRHMIGDVDQRLSLPRNGGREWSELTPDSPLEDLQLSVRARNRLHDLGCSTVADVLKLNLNSVRIGRASREELERALQSHGLWDPALSVQAKGADVRRLSTQLEELRQRIDEHVRHWRTRMDGMEARLKRITQRAD